MSTLQRIIIALLLLVCGIVIYVLFRSDVLFVSVFVGHYSGLFEKFAIANSDNPFCYFLVYCLPDALWYAALLLLQKPYRHIGVPNNILFWMSVALPFALELLQLTGHVSGVFDIFDVVTYLFTVLIILKL